MSESGFDLDGDVAAPPLDHERYFDILRNPNRRALIALLAETPTVSRQELIPKLSAAVTDEATTLTAEERRRLRIAFHHNHLPRLADAGLIEYDSETVTATPTLTAVAQILPETDCF